MNNRQDDSYSGNQRSGKESHNRDKQQNQQPGYRKPAQKEWGEGNYFHTGPSSYGAQDRDQHNSDYRRGGSSNSSYNQGQNTDLNDHYGSRSNSAYRTEKNINYGDRGSNNYQQRNNNNSNDPSKYNGDNQDGSWREHPGSESRYKEDDYRYGSGSHNWYREGRYTQDDDRNSRRGNDSHDERGFFDRMGSGIKNTWNDIMHSDDTEYTSNTPDRQSQSERISSRKRYGSEQYRDNQNDNGYDRSRDKGYEKGPRWADESDSGDDSFYNNTDRNQRYRR